MEKELRRKIKEHDCAFYQTIKVYVPLMPDFRPQETIKRMKEEKQNNWACIYHELQSINYNQDYLELLDIINKGNIRSLVRYIKPNKLVEDFVFSYPALVWLMLYVGPKKTVVPFLLSRGLYLNEIPFKPNHIKYIQSMEDASLLRKIHSYNVIIDYENNLIEEGDFFWLLTGAFRGIEDMTMDDYLLPHSLAACERMDVVRSFIPLKNKDEDNESFKRKLFMIMTRMICQCFNEGAKYILENFSFSSKELCDLSIWAINSSNYKILILLLDRITLEHIPLSHEEVIDVCHHVESLVDKEFLHIILTHPLFRLVHDHIKKTNAIMIDNAIRKNNSVLVEMLLLYFTGTLKRSINLYVKEALRYKRKEIIQILLNQPFSKENIDICSLEKVEQILNE